MGGYSCITVHGLTTFLYRVSLHELNFFIKGHILMPLFWTTVRNKQNIIYPNCQSEGRSLTYRRSTGP